MSIITVQPRIRPPMAGRSIDWNRPEEIQSCPPGLEYLMDLDQLLVKQNVEMMEALTGFETNNKYIILNNSGNRVYFAIEETDWCTRACCGPGRPFDIKILDYQGNEVIHLNRPMACPCYCLPWWPQKLEVSAPPGTVIGRVVQAGTFCVPANFNVQDNDGKTQFTIKGPCCHCSFFKDNEYRVLCRNGINEFGSIRKQWTGIFKEALTDADNFGITFPEDIDITMKATLIGALFLIKIMYNSVEPVVTGQPIATNAYPPQDNQYRSDGRYGVASKFLNVKGPNNNHQVSWVGQQASGTLPAAIQYLSTVDQLIVRQQVELLEVLSGYETANKYVITNNLGHKVFYAVEEVDCRPSMCCGAARSFEMKILDNYGLEVMHIHRPFKCPCCFGVNGCLQELEVSSPPGTLVGKVLQKGGCCDAGKFTIYNKDMEAILLIKGACCICECCSDIDFQILCKNGINEIGKITKQWSGFAQEMVTNADNFGITFPMDIDVSQKITLLGALFLIDFIFFEQQKKRR